MKKLSFVMAFLCLLSSSTIFAQGLHIGKFKVKAIHAQYGQDQDLLSGMDSNYFGSMAKNSSDFEKYSDLPFSGEKAASMICENGNMHLGLALEVNNSMEWNIGINAIINRVDAVSYQSNYLWTGGDFEEQEYTNFSTYADEIALETSLTKRIALSRKRNKLGNSRINLYLGAGTNIGAIFDNEMYVYGSEKVKIEDYSYANYRDLRNDVMGNEEYRYFNERVELNGGFSQRVYGEAGIGFTILRRLELGAQTRYGYGYRVIKGADTKGTELRSFGVFARWILG